jgi:mannose-6-phosphate isomerase-like protein (cupin superfamily)
MNIQQFRLCAALFVVAAAVPARGIQAQEIPGYASWDVEKVETTANRLEASLGDKALVWETLGNWDGHSVYLVLRGSTSRAEVHETESDVQISVRGAATSVVGGELTNPESLPRKQIRGDSIRGGNRRALAPGDIMHIPPGVPHQLLIDAETPYMYILIKIDEEPLVDSSDD